MAEPKFGQVCKDLDGNVVGVYVCPTPPNFQYKRGGSATYPHLVLVIHGHATSPEWEDLEDLPDIWTFTDE